MWNSLVTKLRPLKRNYKQRSFILISYSIMLVKNFRQKLWYWRGVLIAAPTITGIVLTLRLWGLLQNTELSVFDKYVRFRPQQAVDNRITIVEITESDLIKYGFPLPDNILAELLNKIKQQQPKVIGLDVYRDLPVGDGHENLVKVFESTPNLYGIKKVANPPVAAPPILEKLGQVTSNDFVIDSDSKQRRGLLSLADKDKNDIFTLSMTLSLVYLQDRGINPELIENNKIIKLGNTILTPFEGNNGAYVRANAGGYQILLNSYKPRGHFNHISVKNLLSNNFNSDLFKDKIILIGTTAESANDFVNTPYSVDLFHNFLPTPGVEIHAQLVSEILTSVIDKHPLLKTWAEPWEYLWITFWAFAGAILVWWGRGFQLKIKNVYFKIKKIQLFTLSFIFLIVGTYIAFLNAWWIPVVPALLTFSGSAIFVTAYLARTASDLRRTLGRYLTDEVVASLLETPGGLKLVGEKRKVTTLISDIRGFTSISERLPPEEIVRLLNLYLAVMNKIIKHYGGTINDVMGDGLVVFFGAPIQRQDDSERCVACAIAMQLAMSEVNKQNLELNLPELKMGIGINTGEVIVGNIGSEEHIKYTAIGSHVNLAARVESYTTGGQVLISQSTYNEIQSTVKVNGQIQASMKGIAEPVTLYDVSGIGGKYNLVIEEEKEDFIILDKPLLVSYGILEGKHLAGDEYLGQLIMLSSQGGVINAENIPPSLSNLKLNLLDEDNNGVNTLGEIYGKVKYQSSLEGKGFYVRFTLVNPKVEEIFNRFL
jgi:adenylate cyclase